MTGSIYACYVRWEHVRWSMYSMYINLRILGDIGDQLLDLANLEGRDLLNIAQVLHNEFRPTIEVFWKPTLFILSSSRLAHQIVIELTYS